MQKGQVEEGTTKGVVDSKIQQLINEDRNHKVIKSGIEEKSPAQIVIYAHKVKTNDNERAKNLYYVKYLDPFNYQTIKHGYGVKHLNSQAIDKNRCPIACRHLSYSVALKHMKHYHELLGSKESIERQTELKNNDYDTKRVEFSSSHYYLFSLDKFGESLYRLAVALEKDHFENFLFDSENHSMAVTVMHKKNGSYVVKFYDPNDTNTHIRALCANLSAIKNLSVDDLLKLTVYSTRKEAYFPELKLGLLYSPQSSVTNQKRTVDVLATDDSTLGQVLFIALRKGLAQTVLDVTQTILKSNLTQAQKVAQLNTAIKPIPGMCGGTGLYFALLNNQEEAVTYYIKAILNSQLDNKSKVELLTAENKNGTSGVHYASCSTAATYMRLILNSKFDNKVKLRLVNMDWAFTENYYSSTRIFTSTIVNSLLDNKNKIELLEFGADRLDAGILFDSKLTIVNYVDCILNSTLDAKDKLSLLMPEQVRDSLLPYLAKHLSQEVDQHNVACLRGYITGIQALLNTPASKSSSDIIESSVQDNNQENSKAEDYDDTIKFFPKPKGSLNKPGDVKEVNAYCHK